eukprot:TRINITY_DN69272_c0_g1_i1.p1 TRINITY_DN69272_c0_g1~~TRINITY_DN69272_c0_g1_i1.p1  ORF type:complete len:323 (-),score=28.70 TRINITY_DN69272_c0_g1_i1:46-978(-)
MKAGVAASVLLARGVRFDVVSRAGFLGPKSELANELYAFSYALSREPRDHWQRHVNTNSELHTFRDACTGEMLGFQMWRFGSTPDPSVRVLWGGKLRVAPAARRQGLHLVSNLVAAKHAHGAAGGAATVRVALVNVFGFCSLQPALSSWQTPPLADDAAGRAVSATLRPFCEENGFRYDASSGRVDVGQDSPLKTDDLPENWWSRPAVDAFRALPTGVTLSRDATLSRRGSDVFLCWPLDSSNLRSMERRALDTLERRPRVDGKVLVGTNIQGERVYSDCTFDGRGIGTAVASGLSEDRTRPRIKLNAKW